MGANRVVEVAGPGSGTSIRVSGPVGRELIKVVASTSQTPLFEAAKLMQSWPSTSMSGRSASVARDMQVTMDSQPPGHEWDDYNKVIATITGRQVRVTQALPVPIECCRGGTFRGVKCLSGRHALRVAV